MKIENGFVIGNKWQGGKGVMINVDAILRIEMDCGNSPPANRIYFKDGHLPHMELLAE